MHTQKLPFVLGISAGAGLVAIACITFSVASADVRSNSRSNAAMDVAQD